MRTIRWDERYHDEIIDVILEIWRSFTWTSTYKEGYQKAKIFLYQCLEEATYAKILIDKGHIVGFVIAYSKDGNKVKTTHRLYNEVSNIPFTPAIDLYKKNSTRYKHLCSSLKNEINVDLGGEIKLLAVKPSYQGKGLGKKLLREAVAYLHNTGCKKFFLFTDSSCNYIFYQTIGLKRLSENTLDLKKRDYGFKVYIYAGDTNRQTLKQRMYDKRYRWIVSLKPQMIQAIFLLLLVVLIGMYSVDTFFYKIYCKDDENSTKTLEIRHSANMMNNINKTVVLDAGHGGRDGESVECFIE